jgi:hypothetical protein
MCGLSKHEKPSKNKYNMTKLLSGIYLICKSTKVHDILHHPNSFVKWTELVIGAIIAKKTTYIFLLN